MSEKMTFGRQQRKKVPFVTRADTASDELKARTLEAMARCEQEQKRKAKSIRNMPKLALVAAIIALTLLVATGAAFALRYWWEDIFEVNQTQTVNGYTLCITEARISGDFLFMNVSSSDACCICFDGTITNSEGNTTALYSENFPLYGLWTVTFFAPDMKYVVNKADKSYQCHFTAYYYTSENYKKRAKTDDHSDADAVFQFTFDIKNDYVKSVNQSKSYDIDYQIDLDGITLDFQKYYTTDVESFLLTEVICQEEADIDFGELYIKASVIMENGEHSHGYFLNPYYETVTVGTKRYLLLPYSYDNEDGYQYIHYTWDGNHDDDGHNAEYEYERLSIAPPFQIEIHYPQLKRTPSVSYAD